MASGKCLTMTVKRKTVYAMMQPPSLPLPSLSTGVEVVGSKSGPLEAMEKRKAKWSIGVGEVSMVRRLSEVL